MWMLFVLFVALLPPREVPASELTAPQPNELALAMGFRDAAPSFGRRTATEVLVWSGVVSAPDFNGGVTTRSFDAYSQPTSVTDPTSAVWRQSWDMRGRLLSQTDASGITTTFAHDDSDRRTEVRHLATEAGNAVKHVTHDDAGRKRTEIDGLGHRTTTALDPLGRVVSVRDAVGATRTLAGTTERWTYTPTNQIASATDAAGHTTVFAYDDRDRRIAETDPTGASTTYGYDADGHRTTRTLPGGRTWTSTFDAAHRLEAIRSPGGHTTAYGYSDDDALASITDANAHTTTLTTDSQGRVTARTYPAGATWSTTYDGNGNAVTATTPKHGYTRTFDALNRLRSESSGELTRTQTFDANGNRVTATLTTPDGVLARSTPFDAHDRPTGDTFTGPGYVHGQAFGYDPNGNRTLHRDARNAAITQAFDAHDRPTTMTAPEGATGHTWHPDGTLASITHANGTRSDYAYDAMHRVTSITHRSNDIATLTFAYTYDLRGNRTEERRTEAAVPGQPARSIKTVYAYDSDDRLTSTTVTHQPSSSDAPDLQTTWILDPVGNRLSEVVTLLATNQPRSHKTSTYNDRDQLTRITDPVNDLVVDYRYDANGNRDQRIITVNGVTTSQVDYTFDARDRLIRAEPNAPNEPIVQYTYDADDRRVARIETPRIGGVPQPAITTLSVHDGLSLLHEATPTQITDTYRHGAILDRHIQHAGSAATVRHYQLDALRTPVAMTDANGQAVNATTYDAWGNIDQQTADGTSTTPWSLPDYAQSGQSALLTNDGQAIGFTGYQKDSDTGLYYANARWYDPMIGTFGSMDPMHGDPANPVTFSKYLYANGSPLTYVDRDGRIALLADGANTLGSWNDWLQQRADQFDPGYLGASAAFGVGVARGFLGLTEGSLRSVNAAANVGVVASAGVIQANTGYLPQYAEGSARELMGTQEATEQTVQYLQNDGLFKSYDAARAQTVEAYELRPGAISRVSSALTMTATGAGSSFQNALRAVDDAIVSRMPAFKPSSIYAHGDDVANLGHSINSELAKRLSVYKAWKKDNASKYQNLGEVMSAYRRLVKYESPWPDGFSPVADTIQPGTQFKMAVSPGQPSTRPGAFGTFDDIPNVEYVRNELAVKYGWKSQVDRVITYEVVRPLPVKVGPVGPQADLGAGMYMPGGGTQLQMMIPGAQRMSYLKVVREDGIQ